MSLFGRFEVSAKLYKPTDNKPNGITSFNFAGSYTDIKIHIIQLGVIDRIVQGQQFGEYRANVAPAYGSIVDDGDRIVVGTKKYEVLDKPLYLKLFNKYRLNLKEIKRA